MPVSRIFFINGENQYQHVFSYFDNDKGLYHEFNKRYQVRCPHFWINCYSGTGLWGCQTGGLVAPDRQIPLKDGGPHTGNTTANGAVVEYQYTLNYTTPPGGALAIEGKILSAPADSIQVNIYVLAIDGQGQALAKDVLYASGYNNRYASRNPIFKESYNLPPETMAIAFDSYIQAKSGER